MSVIQFGSIHFVYVAAKHNNSHHEQELGDSGKEILPLRGRSRLMVDGHLPGPLEFIEG